MDKLKPVDWVTIPEVLFSRVESEVNRTHQRVAAGDLPHNMVDLHLAQRCSVITEEIGEIAELTKVKEGLKPRKEQELLQENLGLELPVIVRVAIRQELIQTAAICLDWYLAE